MDRFCTLAAMRHIRKIAIFLFLIFSSAGVGKLWYTLKDGFSIRRIGAALPVREREPPFSKELLDGPFRYLGRGRQCYAFESLDQRYVLKVPRFDLYELPCIWKWTFPFFKEKRESIARDRQKRKAFVLESFRIASEDLKEETALLYLHIGDTGDSLGRTTLIDKLGRRYEIDLNRIVFALQEKKTLMMPQFLKAIQVQDRETIERIFDSFLAILERRAHLGIFNKDPSFRKNFAWDDGKGVQIDIGSFYRKKGLEKEDAFFLSMKESAGPIREWLGSLDPALLSRFDERLKEICENPS